MRERESTINTENKRASSIYKYFIESVLFTKKTKTICLVYRAYFVDSFTEFALIS